MIEYMSAWMSEIAMIIGWVGVACSLSAYWFVSTGRMTGDSLRYQLLNITACICLAIACFATSSWPSLVTNLLFIMIGVHMTWKVRDRLYARLRALRARMVGKHRRNSTAQLPAIVEAA